MLQNTDIFTGRPWKWHFNGKWKYIMVMQQWNGNIVLWGRGNSCHQCYALGCYCCPCCGKSLLGLKEEKREKKPIRLNVLVSLERSELFGFPHCFPWFCKSAASLLVSSATLGAPPGCLPTGPLEPGAGPVFVISEWTQAAIFQCGLRFFNETWPPTLMMSY